jgi:hypothetical protein
MRFGCYSADRRGQIRRSRACGEQQLTSGSAQVTKDETRKILQEDIVNFRRKAKYYDSLHLYEAKKYANNLADNIELALTTMPSDEDTEID